MNPSDVSGASPWWGRWPIIASVLAGGALILMAWSLEPVPDQDASYFVGASMSLAAGDGLVNRVDGLLWTRDPEGQARLMAYPIVWPALLSVVGGTSIRQTSVAVACVATLSLLLTALLLRSAASRGPLAASVAVLSIASYSSAFANGAMRPEALSSALILVLALAIPRLPSTLRREVLVGAFAGALAHVQVPLAIYGMIGWSFWISFHMPLRDAVRRGVVVGLAALGAFVFGLYLHPYGGTEYFAALGRNIAGIPSEFSWRGWLGYWVFGVRFPGLLATVTLGACLAAWRLVRGEIRPVSPALLSVSALGVVALLLHDTIPQPSRWYESIVVLPFAYLVMVDAMGVPRMRRGPRQLLAMLSVVALSLNGAGFARRVLIWVSKPATEPTFSEAQALVRRELQRRAPVGVVATTAQAWMLLPDHRRACVVPLSEDLRFGTSCRVHTRVLLLQQARRPFGARAPERIESGDVKTRPADSISTASWRLVADHFSHDAPSRLSALSPRASGWGFAVYVRDDGIRRGTPGSQASHADGAGPRP